MVARNWDFVGNGFWDIATNWSDDALPSTADDVTIDITGSDFVVTHRMGTTEINSLLSNESLTLTGGSITVQGTTDINGLLTISGGTTNLNGISLIENINLSSGTLSGSSITLESNGLWTGGRFNGGLTIAELGSLEISGGAGDLAFSSILENQGTINWVSGRIIGSSGAVWNNTSTGIIDIQGDLTLLNSVGGSSINNAGTLQKSSGTGTANIGSPVDNSGTINVQSGVLEFDNVINLLDGSQITGSGKVLASNTLDISGFSTVSGNLEFSGNTLTGTGSINKLTWTKGNYDADLTIREGGELRIDGPAVGLGDLQLLNNLGNQGTINWVSGRLLGGRGAVWNNTSTGIIDIQGDLTLLNSVGGSSINNAGTLQKSSGTGTANIGSPVDNSGTINVQSGVLEFDNVINLLDGSQITGSGKVLASNTLDISGFNTVSGNLEFSGNTLTGTGSINKLTWTKGNYDADLTIREGGELRIDGPAVGLGDLQLLNNLGNQGTINWVSGRLLGGRGAVWNNTSTGIIDIQGDLTLLNSVGGSSINNAGTLQKSSGTGTANIGSPVDNSGTINVQSGVLEFDNVINLLDGSQITGSGKVLASNTLDISGFNTVSGNLEFSGNTLTGTGSINKLTWTKGNYDADLTIREGGELRIDGPAVGLGDLQLLNNLGNQGTINWVSGRLLGGRGAVWNNTSTGIIDIQGDLTLLNSVGGSSINNAGTLQKSSGTGTANIGSQFNNSGIVKILNSTLNFSGGYVQTEGNTILQRGALQSLTPLEIQGGQVSGVGNIIGNINNSGLLTPGSTAGEIGTLAINGNYAETNAARIDIEIASLNTFDRINFSGLATFDGTINVSLLNGYIPEISDSFEVITFGSANASGLDFSGLILSGLDAIEDSLDVDEDAILNGNLLTNDIDSLGFTPTINATNIVLSVDGTAKSLTEINGDTVVVGQEITLVSGALLSVNSDGSFTYDQNGVFNTLADGETSTESFTYTLADTDGNADTAQVTFTINGQNDAPIADDDSYSTNEDENLIIDALAGVLNGDIDIDANLLTVTVDTAPNNGDLTLNPDGSFVYNPNANFNGIDTFTYMVNDGDGGIDTGTVTITVNPVNDNPTAQIDTLSTDEDTALTIEASSLLINDTDVDGDILFLDSVSNPVNGTVVLDTNGDIRFTPNANFNGDASFLYTISDGNGGTDTSTVNITVIPINDAPTAVDDGINTNEDTAVTVDVLANDSDLDGDPLNIDSFTQPSNGSVVNNNDGTFTYTPRRQFHRHRHLYLYP